MVPVSTADAAIRPALSTFTIESLALGEKKILDFTVGKAPDGTSWGLTILAVRGRQEGPTLLVNGGTHGDEYEGPVTVQGLYQTLDPQEISGTWVGIPVLNEPAMSVPQRCGKFDNQDLARVFPGKADGTLTEQIAYNFGQYVLKQANYYIDLHSAGSALRMVFLSGYSVVANQEVLLAQRKMAFAFGGELVWGTPYLPGRTLSQAQEFGIPSIYAETTGTGGLRREDLNHYTTGVKNVMRAVGMLSGPFPSKPSRFFRETADDAHNEGFLQIDHPSPRKGLFVPSVELWDKVLQNHEVGTVVDPGGRTLAVIHARRSGHVILIRHWLSVNAADPLLVIVENLDE